MVVLCFLFWLQWFLFQKEEVRITLKFYIVVGGEWLGRGKTKKRGGL